MIMVPATGELSANCALRTTSLYQPGKSWDCFRISLTKPVSLPSSSAMACEYKFQHFPPRSPGGSGPAGPREPRRGLAPREPRFSAMRAFERLVRCERLRRWQLDRKGGAALRVVCREHPSAVLLGDPAGDRQAEAGSFSGTGGIGLVEALEDALEILPRDSGSVVGDHQPRRLGPRHQAYLDVPVRLRVVHGVVDQDPEQ